MVNCVEKVQQGITNLPTNQQELFFPRQKHILLLQTPGENKEKESRLDNTAKDDGSCISTNKELKKFSENSLSGILEL